MILFAGTYKLEHSGGGASIGDTGLWRCTLSFDGLEVTAYAGRRKRAFRQAHRAMIKATKLRDAIRSVKGLCDDS